jgi:hypothetical protein
MTTDKKTKAWPLHQYDGNAEDYDTYETDKDAWSITNKNYDTHIDSIDPSTIPRVVVAYTDAAGVLHPVEHDRAYNLRLEKDAALGKLIWASAIVGYKDEARRTATSAKHHDARKMFKAIEDEHGTKTTKQATNFVRELNTRMKETDQTIDKFNAQWRQDIKTMIKNKMGLPEPFLINLYLISLGEPYIMLEAMVAVMPATDRTLKAVMKLAEDHHCLKPKGTRRDNGEARHDDIALSADQDTNRGRKQQRREYAQQATNDLHCTNCGKQYHTVDECFARGGALAQLSFSECQDHLAKRRRERAQGTTQKPTDAVQLALMAENAKLKALLAASDQSNSNRGYPERQVRDVDEWP